MELTKQFETLRKAAPFEVTELQDDGHFIGLASVYGNVDLGGDIVQRGAFTKTLQERGPRRTLKYMHRESVGFAELEDSDEGLIAKGKFNVDLPRARDVLSMVRFYRDNGMRSGMSIGVMVNDKEHKGKIRILKDLTLIEVTVTDPDAQINPDAGIDIVKSLEADEQALLSLFRELKQGESTAPEKFRALLEAAGIATVLNGAVHKSTGPVVDHSELSSTINQLREVYKNV